MINTLLTATQGLMSNPTTLLIGIQGLLAGDGDGGDGITMECFKNASTENQLYYIIEALSEKTGYIPPSRECFKNLSPDYQWYHVWRSWGGGS